MIFRRFRILRTLLPAVLLWLGACFVSYAQQEPDYIHYYELEPQFNPATVGKSSQLLINAGFQSHPMGVKQGGSTFFTGANTAFAVQKTRHGVGAYFQNDAIGLFTKQHFAIQYSYQFRLFGGTLNVGAEAEMLNEKVDGSKANLAEGNDLAFPSGEVSGSRFDAGVGVYYQRKNLYVGLSAIHLMAPTINLGETYQMDVKRHYYLTGGYNIKLKNPFFKIAPSCFVRYDGTDIRATITGRLCYEKEDKFIHGGVAYTPQRSVALIVGGRFHGVNLSYSYEAFTSGLGLERGQHEVTLGYSMDLDFGKKGRNLHKSVRWL